MTAIFKSPIHAITIQGLIDYTNVEISRWYENVEKDYGVIGFGDAKYDNSSDSIIIDYTENGVKNTWSMAFYPEYLKEQNISWIFNCWQELT